MIALDDAYGLKYSLGVACICIPPLWMECEKSHGFAGEVYLQKQV
jgi:hypothetical protein